MKKPKCKICKAETQTIFNIDFNPISICEDCAKAIFIQQAKWYVNIDFQKPPFNSNKTNN